MSDHPSLEERTARLRERMEALKRQPPLEKARTFLRSFCAGPQGLDEIQEQIRFAANFGSLPLHIGYRGLETVLADPSLSPETLVSLVKDDARQHRAPALPDEARRFLEEILAIARRELHYDDSVASEENVYFGPDEVFRLEDAEGSVRRLRCIIGIGVEDKSYYVLVPEGAADDEGPFTFYRYAITPEQNMIYERVTDPLLMARLLKEYQEILALG